jgi:hypothetical protein
MNMETTHKMQVDLAEPFHVHTNILLPPLFIFYRQTAQSWIARRQEKQIGGVLYKLAMRIMGGEWYNNENNNTKNHRFPKKNLTEKIRVLSISAHVGYIFSPQKLIRLVLRYNENNHKMVLFVLYQKEVTLPVKMTTKQAAMILCIRLDSVYLSGYSYCNMVLLLDKDLSRHK